MKIKKNPNKTKKNYNIPTVVVVLLLFVALAVGIYFIVKDAGLVGKAFESIKSLYNILFT